MRRLMVLAVFFLPVATAPAQDMALSQILIDGEGWRGVTGESPGFPVASEVTTKTGHRLTAAAVKASGLKEPSGLVLWADEGTLVVGDAGGKYLWAFRVEADGTLTCGDRYYSLRVKAGQTASGVRAMTLDRVGRLYAATPLGVQVFDPTGRLCGVLTRPGEGELSAVAFFGDALYVKCGDRVYSRKVRGRPGS